QAADGLPQGHGCLVDDLEGDGQFGRGVPLHARGQGVVGGEDDAEVVARVQVPQYGGGPVGLGAVAERGQQTGGTPADGDGLRSFRGAGGRGTTGTSSLTTHLLLGKANLLIREMGCGVRHVGNAFGSRALLSEIRSLLAWGM